MTHGLLGTHVNWIGKATGVANAVVLTILEVALSAGIAESALVRQQPASS